MKSITIVDARMGRGKTTAAIRYMNERKGTHRFLYVTPYLTEVDRICDCCGFIQPDYDVMSKSTSLKILMNQGRSIAFTHALFSIIDQEALDIAHEKGYSLIIDESIDLIENIHISAHDFNIVTKQLTERDEDGWLTWNEADYTGCFSRYKALADAGRLALLDHSLISIVSPEIFRCFNEVIMMTYLFNGQYQRAYLQYFEIPYHIVGIETDRSGPKFSTNPDCPPPLDLKDMINIVVNPKMNAIGNSRTALSKAWYTKRGRNHEDMAALRKHMYNYFQKVTGHTQEFRIWTCFKNDKDKLIPTSGRFRHNYLPMNVRATNDYRQATDVAYLVNRFCDPNLAKFFATKGFTIDHSEFALAEMLQFIWRSAIRDNKPINLYIPSKRMRQLLIDWIDQVSQGGT